MKKSFLLLLTLLFCGVASQGVNGQTFIPNTTAVIQNFDGMAATTTLPSNWRMQQSATPTWAAGTATLGFQASSGSPTAGGTYNWGSSVAERAAGVMTSGGYASPNSLMAFFQNTNANAITSLTISYDLERYRRNTANASVQFFYSTNGTTWMPATAGDIATSSIPTGANLYGYPQATIGVAAFTISSLAIPNNGNIYLRWNLNTTGSNSQGIAVDNVSVTAAYCITPVIGDDLDDFACSGTSSAIDLYSDQTGTTVTWTAALTSGSATGFSDSATPIAVGDVGFPSGTNDIDQVLTNTGTGNAVVTYTITPTANGCPGDPYVVAITVFPALDITFAPTCNGSTYDLGFTISGGTPAYYATFASAGTLGVSSITDIPIATTTVSLDIEDDETCTYTESYTFTQPTLSLVASCGGGAGTGILTPTFTAGAGGTPSYNPSTLTGLANGTYTVTVTESPSGCQATASATVSCTVVSCTAAAAAPTGTITPTSFCVTGGLLTGSTATDPTVLNFFENDRYYLLVDDATGIVVSNATTVANLAAPSNAGITPQIYKVYSLAFDVVQGVSIINGTSTITAGANIIKDLGGDALLPSPTATSCMALSAAAATTITVYPALEIGDDLDDTACSGTSSAIDLYSNQTGTTVTWTAVLTSGSATGFSDSATPIAVNDINTTSGTNDIDQVLTNTGTGNAVVTYTITPTANGCPGNPYVVAITVFPALDIAFAPTCNGSTYDLGFTISGGTPAYYATYATAGTLGVSSITNIPVATTTVSLDIEDDETCTYTESYTFTQPTLSLVASCGGGAGTGILTPTFTAGAGGTPSYNPSTLTGLADGTYTVTVTESPSGCQATASATVSCVTICTPPTAPTLTSATYCLDAAAATLDAANAGATYSWSNGATTQTITPSTATAGTTIYTVTVTNAGAGTDCSTTASATIIVNALPTLSLVASCGGGAGTGILTPTFTAGAGGTPSYNPSTLTGLADGTYTVTVTESPSGCQATATALINCSGALIAIGSADAADPCYCVTPPTLDANNVVLTNGTFGDVMIITTSPVSTSLVWEVSATIATTPIVGTNFTNNNDGTYTLNITYPAGVGGAAGSWSITAIEKTGSGLAPITISGGGLCAYNIGTLADVLTTACSGTTINLIATPAGGTYGGAATAAGTYTPIPTTSAQGPFPYNYTYDAHPAVGIYPACPITLRADITVPACPNSCTPAVGTW